MKIGGDFFMQLLPDVILNCKNVKICRKNENWRLQFGIQFMKFLFDDKMSENFQEKDD